ncbi:MAG: sugar lactone lactonase YvrE [Halioglobus sp.]|jgi:sugar lactone lactonase YvrE
MAIIAGFERALQTLGLLTLIVLSAACSDSSDRAIDMLEPSLPPVPVTPPVELMVRYELSSLDSIPEGIAFDPQDRAFYATSLQGASITKIDADGTESLFRPADDRARLVGAKVDPAARRLWVCASRVDNIDNRVWVFDLDSGEQVMEFLLAALASNGACNDLALDAMGVAYVTDSNNPNIYRLDPATELGSVLISDPLLADTLGIGLGSNGITVSPDGSVLIVAKFVPAQLLVISLPNASTIAEVALNGDDLPAPDGLVFLDDNLYSVSDRAVSRIKLDPQFTAGTVKSVEQIGGLSTATVAEGALYVIKSEVTHFSIGQPLETPFEIFVPDMSAFDDI